MNNPEDQSEITEQPTQQRNLLKHFAKTILFAFGGLVIGYFVGVAWFCSQPNAEAQCGLGAVFFTAPIGLLAGGLLYQLAWFKN